MPNLLKHFDGNNSTNAAEVSTNSSGRSNSMNQTSITSDVFSESGKSRVKGRRDVSVMHKIESFAKMNSKSSHYDKQHKTESSSSSSSQAVLPDSSQNLGNQEISMEQQFCKASVSSCMNKLVGRSSCGSMQGLGDPFRASVCLSPVEEKTIRLCSGDSSNTKKPDCLSGNAEHSSCSTEPDTHAHSHLNQQCSSEKASKESSPVSVHESKAILRRQESSFRTSRSENGTGADQSTSIFEFDLNENMEADEVECPQQTASEAISSLEVVKMLEPITVVAKMGVPVGVPRAPLQFGGEQGWRTSRAASAFRPAEVISSKKGNDRSDIDGSGRPLGLQGIDLNIAFESDSWSTEPEHMADPLEPQTKVSAVDVRPKGMERFGLDLNSHCEKDDTYLKSGIQALDLNNKSSVEDPIENFLQRGPSNQPPRSSPALNSVAVSSQANTRHAGSDNMRSAYWVDLRSMPGLTHGQSQPFLVAGPGVFPTAEQLQSMVPMQSKMSFAPVPPAFYIGPTASDPSTLYAPTMVPHVSSQHGSTFIPQVSGSVVSAYPGNLHILESNQGLTAGRYTANMRPNFVVNNGGCSVENGNRVSETRDRRAASNAFVEERLRSAQQISMSPFKRSQPEGGWDSLQLNCKQSN